jgi:predicted alternative tryptophan synthase beta-subunit
VTASIRETKLKTVLLMDELPRECYNIHAIKATKDIALECKRTNEAKTILFNLSGHGLLDLRAYEDKLANRLVDY